MKIRILLNWGVNNDNTINKNAQKSHEKAPFRAAFSPGKGINKIFCEDGRHFRRSKVGRGDLRSFI